MIYPFFVQYGQTRDLNIPSNYCKYSNTILFLYMSKHYADAKTDYSDIIHIAE